MQTFQNWTGVCKSDPVRITYFTCITKTVFWDWRPKVRNHSKELMYSTGNNYFPSMTQLFAISIYEHTCKLTLNNRRNIYEETCYCNHNIYVCILLLQSHKMGTTWNVYIWDILACVKDYRFNVTHTHQSFYITSIYLFTFVMYIM